MDVVSAASGAGMRLSFSRLLAGEGSAAATPLDLAIGNDRRSRIVSRLACNSDQVHGCRRMSWEGMMKAQTAKRLIEFLLDQARQQNQFLLYNQNKIDGDDFDQVKKIIAHTMGVIYQDGLHPVLKDHPDLTPDGLIV